MACGVYDTAILLDIKIKRLKGKVNLDKHCKDYSKKKQNKTAIFVLIISPNAKDSQHDDLKDAIKKVRKTYKEKCFIHLIANSMLDVSNFSRGFNILIKNSPKFYAYPPQEGTRTELSGDFYVDTISISSTHPDQTSFSSGVLLATTRTKYDFNDKEVSYIGGKDSTVVGSSNGDFCLIDYYFYNRFPFELLTFLHEKNPRDLKDYMKNHELSKKEEKVYEHLYKYLDKVEENSIGYPVNQLWDDSELDELFTLLIKEKIMRNTENSKFKEGMVLSQGKDDKGKPYVDNFINEIIDFFKTELFSQDQRKDFDGYVTTGGTEGNYIGLFIARHLLGEDTVLFLTKETHYSVSKGASIFGLTIQYVNVISHESGNMDCQDLKYKIERYKNKISSLQSDSKSKKKLKIVVNVNLASTLKGSIDNLIDIKKVLNDCNIKEDDSWIHCDGAAQGFLLPFIKESEAKKVVPFKFEQKNGKEEHVSIDSISISGHKFMGAPFPCGICMFRVKSAKKVITEFYKKLSKQSNPKSDETEEFYKKFRTITSGSQNYYMAVVIWKRIKQLGRNGLRDFARNCMTVTEYAMTELEKAAGETGVRPFRNKYSNVITLTPSPSEDVMNKYNLPNIEGGDNIGHIVIMPHVSAEKIDEFIEDIKEHPVLLDKELKN